MPSNAEDYVQRYQSPLPPYMEKIKSYGLSHKVPIVRDDMGQMLRLFCRMLKPQKILEIGCGISYSTHWMLLGAEESEITALDYNYDRLNCCVDYLNQSGFSKQVKLVQGWAEDFFKDNHGQYDLIFQDSTKKNYVEMIGDCYRFLKPGGWLVADNIFFNGKVFGLSKDQERKYSRGVETINDFNLKMSEHPGFQTDYFPFSDGILVAQKVAN